MVIRFLRQDPADILTMAFVHSQDPHIWTYVPLRKTNIVEERTQSDSLQCWSSHIREVVTPDPG